MATIGDATGHFAAPSRAQHASRGLLLVLALLLARARRRTRGLAALLHLLRREDHEPSGASAVDLVLRVARHAPDVDHLALPVGMQDAPVEIRVGLAGLRIDALRRQLAVHDTLDGAPALLLVELALLGPPGRDEDGEALSRVEQANVGLLHIGRLGDTNRAGRRANTATPQRCRTCCDNSTSPYALLQALHVRRQLRTVTKRRKINMALCDLCYICYT